MFLFLSSLLCPVCALFTDICMFMHVSMYVCMFVHLPHTTSTRLFVCLSLALLCCRVSGAPTGDRSWVRTLSELAQLTQCSSFSECANTQTTRIYVRCSLTSLSLSSLAKLFSSICMYFLLSLKHSLHSSHALNNTKLTQLQQLPLFEKSCWHLSLSLSFTLTHTSSSASWFARPSAAALSWSKQQKITRPNVNVIWLACFVSSIPCSTQMRVFIARFSLHACVQVLAAAVCSNCGYVQSICLSTKMLAVVFVFYVP